MATTELYPTDYNEWRIISSDSEKNLYTLKSTDNRIINISGNTSVLVLETGATHQNHRGKPVKEVSKGEIIINVSS